MLAHSIANRVYCDTRSQPTFKNPGRMWTNTQLCLLIIAAILFIWTNTELNLPSIAVILFIFGGMYTFGPDGSGEKEHTSDDEDPAIRREVQSRSAASPARRPNLNQAVGSADNPRPLRSYSERSSITPPVSQEVDHVLQNTRRGAEENFTTPATMWGQCNYCTLSVRRALCEKSMRVATPVSGFVRLSADDDRSLSASIPPHILGGLSKESAFGDWAVFFYLANGYWVFEGLEQGPVPKKWEHLVAKVAGGESCDQTTVLFDASVLQLTVNGLVPSSARFCVLLRRLPSENCNDSK